MNSVPSEVPDLLYSPEFISREEEAELLRNIDREPWLSDLRRRVQHYGYKYDYRSRSIDDSMRMGPLPAWLLPIRERLVERGLFCTQPDQVIVNEYEPGQGIRDHVDCEPCFGPTIVSLSLASACVMNFTHRHTAHRVVLLLEPRSAIVLRDRARYEWMHGIPARKNDVWHGKTIRRGRRVSLTFRQVIIKDR